jgi:hypothetical protein
MRAQGSPFRRAMWFALFVASMAVLPAIAGPAKLAPGDPMVPIDADALSGTHSTLPADRAGMPFVAIFGFSQKGGDASARWSHAFVNVLPSRVAIYAIADLSRVPGLFRGFAVAGIRKQASPLQPEHRDHVLLLTRGNPWAQIVPGGSDDDAVIVAVDAAGILFDGCQHVVSPQHPAPSLAIQRRIR